MGKREDESSTPRDVSPGKVAGAGMRPNLSEAQRLNRELNRLKRANSKLRRMEALRVDLTHMIVHDLKGPLAEVIANLNLLEQEALSQVQKEYLGSAILGAEELLRRVQNILEVYRLETKKKMIRPTFFDPLEAIQGVVRGFARLASMREVSIRIHNAGGPHSLHADKDLFVRIVLNLVINAIEHTPSGGEIAVDLSWSQDSRRLQVAVSDVGPGIRKSDHKRIFRKLFTARYGRVAGNVGLGLPFCKLAVEAHGGEIWIETLDGSGSRFVFEVPNSPPKYSGERRYGQFHGSDR